MEILLFLFMLVIGFAIMKILTDIQNINLRIEDLEQNSSIEWELWGDKK